MIECKEYALKLITFKDRTEKELIERLKEKKFSEENIEATVEFMKEYGYINDKSYTERYVSDCVKLKAWGKNRIRKELLYKGIERELIDKKLDELQFDTREILEKEMEKRFKNADFENPKQRARIFSYFARRGYSLSEIRGAINNFCSFEDILNDDWEVWACQ